MKWLFLLLAAGLLLNAWRAAREEDDDDWF